MTQTPTVSDIIFITQYAFKIIDSMPDNIIEIKIMGDILYSYFIAHPEIAHSDTPILSYEFLSEYNMKMLKLLDSPDSELTIEELTNKHTIRRYSRVFESYFITHNTIPIELNNIIDLSRFTHLESLFIYKISCKSIPKIPSTLKYLYCRSCNVTSIGKLPKTLSIFNCSENRMRKLPLLRHTKLQTLFCNENKIKVIPHLPHSVEWLYCYSNKMYGFPFGLPNALLFLCCSNNDITDLPHIPPNVIGLYLENNYISYIPKLPKTLIDLFFANNKVSIMPELPSFLKRITCNANPLREYTPFPPSVEYANIDGKLMDISKPRISIRSRI